MTERLPELRRGSVERRDFVRWVGTINDVDSPVHFDDDYAREQGLPSVFAPGMLQAAALADYAAGYFGARQVRRCRVRFAGIVWPGDELTFTGHVTNRTADAVDVELQCARPDGEVAVTAWMTFAIGEPDTTGGRP